MSIKIRKDAALPERQIVTALIVSDPFINSIQPIFDLELLQTKYARIVAEWCLEYYLQYEKSPKGIIQDIFNAKKSSVEETTAELISTFLESISDEYDRNENFNYRYVLDQAQKYLRFRKLKQLADNINSDLSSDDVIQAEAEVANFHQIRLPESQGINLFKDLDKVRYALENHDRDIIFKFRGVLGEVINDSCRGELLAFSAPEKRGKTWWMIEVSMICVFNGFNVAFFSLEMLENQMLTRQVQYLTGRPVYPRDLKCAIPYLSKNEFVKTKPNDKPLLEPAHAVKRLEAVWPMTRGASIELTCWPPSTKSIIDIKAQLDLWERYNNWIPDCIIVDHADRMTAKDNRQADYRHRIDSIWEDLKSLALERHCLVVTATHSTKASHSKKISKESSTAEDKRKAGHVDRMIGLNQSEEDKKNHIMTLNTLFERNADGKSHIDVGVLHQFSIGKPYLDSFIKKNKEEK